MSVRPESRAGPGYEYSDYPVAWAVRAVAEPAPAPISEADLSIIWEGQRYPRGALTMAGVPVTVLYPGRKGGGAGPDFRDAVVRLDGEARRGDVELHVRASCFLQHGHHLDPAYDGLVLHVVFQDDAGGSSPLPCGDRVPVAAFAPWVQARAADIASWLTAPALWREPCQDADARLGGEPVSEVVRRAGAERFQARTRQMSGAVLAQGADEALWQALLEALGYGGNREGFRRLSGALPASLLREVALRSPDDQKGVVYAALMSVAGLASTDRTLPRPLSPPIGGRAGRPANRPRARLAAAAGLFCLCRGEFAAHAVESVSGAGDARELAAHWRPAKLDPGHSALGQGRLTEVLLNAVLPFVSAVRPDLANRCLDLADELPALPPYGKTLFLERNLVRSDGRRRARQALDQQGLLDLHANWCSQGGCGRCPLS